MTTTDEIAPEENLGRGVFSSGHRKRARRSRTPYHVFLEKDGEVKISVDRLDCAPEIETAAIADRIAADRSTTLNRSVTFYGWAVVVEEHARANERRTIPTPQPDNPYHADIILPPLAAEDRVEQKRHAQELADASTWRERPDRGQS